MPDRRDPMARAEKAESENAHLRKLLAEAERSLREETQWPRRDRSIHVTRLLTRMRSERVRRYRGPSEIKSLRALLHEAEQRAEKWEEAAKETAVRGAGQAAELGDAKGQIEHLELELSDVLSHAERAEEERDRYKRALEEIIKRAIAEGETLSEYRAGRLSLAEVALSVHHTALLARRALRDPASTVP